MTFDVQLDLRSTAHATGLVKGYSCGVGALASSVNFWNHDGLLNSQCGFFLMLRVVFTFLAGLGMTLLACSVNFWIMMGC